MSVPEHDYAKVCSENRDLLDKVSILSADRTALREAFERAERQAGTLRMALHGLWDNVGTLLAEIHGSGPLTTTLEVVGQSLDKASAALAAYREGK